MPKLTASFLLTSPEDTARFATCIGSGLVPGDTVLLNGDVGAGKTHFARHLIQSLLITPEDVPSPTFTLVQCYETNSGPLWHSDLYRISSVSEIEELGLTEAFDTAICLIEWPDRMAELEPRTALTLWFADGPTDNARQVNASWTNNRWSDLMAKWTTQ